MMREGRELTLEEQKKFRDQFRKDDRVDRIFNEILSWDK